MKFYVPLAVISVLNQSKAIPKRRASCQWKRAFGTRLILKLSKTEHEALNKYKQAVENPKSTKKEVEAARDGFTRHSDCSI
jgi:hypothetical protein